MKKRSTGLFSIEVIWNSIRSVVLDGVKEIWERRCERNVEQKLTWSTMKRMEEEWKWSTKWQEIGDMDEEVWTEELSNEELNDLELEQEWVEQDL